MITRVIKAMNGKNQGALDEKDYYQPIMEGLENLFKVSFGDAITELYLEITANGNFSNRLKSKVPEYRNIIFVFLRRRTSPDVAGFVDFQFGHGDSGFIVVEFKKEKLELDDVYQARKYGELFDARYAFLVSLEQIPEELKRLPVAVPTLFSIAAYKRLTLVTYDGDEFIGWFPENPFGEKR